MNVTFRQLRAFCAVYETRSFTGAAEILHVTQSAVSRLCAELEKEVGLPLFERSTRQVSPCDGAADLYAYAQEILGTIRLAQRSLSSLAGLERGTVAIASSPMMMQSMFCPVIAEFQPAHPGIHFELHELSTDDTIRVVRDGTVDIGLASLEEDDPKLVREIVHRDPMFAVARADHPVSACDRVDWRQLAAYEHITLRNVYSVRRTLDRILAAQGVVLPSRIVTGTLATALDLAHRGLGICVVPGYVRGHARNLGLKIVEIEGNAGHAHELSLIRRRENRPSLAATVFIERLRIHLSSLSDTSML